VTSLLVNHERRRATERAASNHAARFDWPVVVRQFEESLDMTIAAARAANGRGRVAS
jgi:hypothetical protein